MAHLNKTVLGKVRGSLGDITFRQRNGKNIVSLRPGSFVPGNDPNSIARRMKFSLSIKLSQAINDIDGLKHLWMKDAPAGLTSFNYIMKTNYQLVSDNEIPGVPYLAPQPGFNISASAVNITADSVEVNLDALGAASGINVSTETKFALAGILYLREPSNGLASPYSFISLLSAEQDADIENPVSFNILLSSVESQKIGIYQSVSGFFILLTLDTNGNIIHYSNTFTG